MDEELLRSRLKLLERDLEETRRSLVRAKQKGEVAARTAQPKAGRSR